MEPLKITGCGIAWGDKKSDLAVANERISQAQFGNQSGVLPRGVIIANDRFVVHQSPPTVRKLFWKEERCWDWDTDDWKPDKNVTFNRAVTIALPYVISVLINNDGYDYDIEDRCYLFFRNSPLKNKKDKLYYPALLNCADSAICLGAVPSRLESTENPLDIMKWFQSRLYTSRFNTEIIVDWNKYESHKKIHPIEKWEENSLSDPSFVTRIAWKQATTLHNLLDEYGLAGKKKDSRHTFWTWKRFVHHHRIR